MSAPNSPAQIFGSAGTPVIYTGSGTVADPWVSSLTAGQTYYVELGHEDHATSWYQFRWDAAIIITSITFKSTCIPREELTTWAASALGWDAEPDIATITVAGGSASHEIVRLEGNGAPRQRGEIVVGGTGGSLVVYQKHKRA